MTVLSSHRYYLTNKVGFSGDVANVNWATLSYQPYFSATASNVGFGFWSHDITGGCINRLGFVDHV